MGLIGSLNTAVGGNVIDPTEYNQNLTAIRDAFNNTAVLTDYARTITVQHTFNPTTSIAPFVLGANAQGNLVTGLNADQLDGQQGSFYQNAGNLNAGTIPSARVQGDYTGITAVGVLTAGTVPASLLSGTIASARISGAYTGITAVGTIATGVWQGTAIADAYLAALSASKLTGSIADARVQQSNVTQHQAALSIAATQLTGTIASARLSGSYTGITAVGTLGSLAVTNAITGGSLSVTGALSGASLNLGTSTISDVIKVSLTGQSWGSLSPNDTQGATLTVAGAAVGDHVLISITDGTALGGLNITASVPSAGFVYVFIENAGSFTRDLTSVNLDVLLIRMA